MRQRGARSLRPVTASGVNRTCLRDRCLRGRVLASCAVLVRGVRSRPGPSLEMVATRTSDEELALPPAADWQAAQSLQPAAHASQQAGPVEWLPPSAEACSPFLRPSSSTPGALRSAGPRHTLGLASRTPTSRRRSPSNGVGASLAVEPTRAAPPARVPSRQAALAAQSGSADVSEPTFNERWSSLALSKVCNPRLGQMFDLWSLKTNVCHDQSALLESRLRAMADRLDVQPQAKSGGSRTLAAPRSRPSAPRNMSEGGLAPDLHAHALRTGW